MKLASMIPRFYNVGLTFHSDLSSKKLTALEELGLPGCGITGRIPTEMGNLVDL